ncbi:MAG TPA: hypothetical protein VFB22_03265 [Candidatus Baltobacteraceae bacterium]|nr:hypothetical protein [Candidatus Baltobacteraceae bacterium]
MLRPALRFTTVLLFSLTLVAGLSAQAPAPSAPATQRWLLVSDVHFDPFADPALVDRLAAAPPGGWTAIFASAHDPVDGLGTDTNETLLESSLAQMQATTPDPAVVLIDGDFLAHQFRTLFDRTARVHDDAAYRAFVDKTIAFLALRFGQTFPHAAILPSVGNNDSYCGDYMSTPNSPFLAHMAAAFGPLIARGASAPDFETTFSAAGHYVASIPGTTIRIVVPNSVVWSADYDNRCGDPHANPTQDELAWFASALRPTHRDEHAWVLTHIPPGIDVYASLSGQHVPTLTYSPAPAAQVPSLVDGADTVVTEFIAGHLHTNGFRIVSNGGSSQAVPVVTVPSISPIFANDPSYFDATVSAQTGVIADYTAYALGGLLPHGMLAGGATESWHREYAFASAYGEPDGVTATSLADLQGKLATSTPLRLEFENWFVSGSPVHGMTESNWRAYWCADARLTAATWEPCAAASGS